MVILFENTNGTAVKNDTISQKNVIKYFFLYLIGYLEYFRFHLLAMNDYRFFRSQDLKFDSSTVTSSFEFMLSLHNFCITDPSTEHIDKVTKCDKRRNTRTDGTYLTSFFFQLCKCTYLKLLNTGNRPLALFCTQIYNV